MSTPLHLLGPLSVIIPAYNAGGVIESTAGAVTSWLSEHSLPHQIIVVDDGSTDDTATRAERVLAAAGTGRVIKLGTNQGKGAAVRAGMLASAGFGSWAMFLDADHSTHISHVTLVADAAAEGAEVVVGSRRAVGATETHPRPTVRRLLGRTFPMLVGAIARAGVADTQCGFKALRNTLIQPVFAEQRVSRFAFDVEMLLRARRAGASVAEIPVAWDNPAQSTLRVSRDAPAMLRDTIVAAWYLRRNGPTARRLLEENRTRLGQAAAHRVSEPLAETKPSPATARPRSAAQ
jgi:dolichyl-phosphate beta-glucosyltransferase